MRWTVVFISVFFVSSSMAATEANTFEQSFQKFGKKLDEAKAKGQEIGQEIKAKTKDTSEKALEETKEARTDWKKRLEGAFSELSAGMKGAWRKLTGEE